MGRRKYQTKLLHSANFRGRWRREDFGLKRRIAELDFRRLCLFYTEDTRRPIPKMGPLDLFFHDVKTRPQTKWKEMGRRERELNYRGRTYSKEKCSTGVSMVNFGTETLWPVKPNWRFSLETRSVKCTTKQRKFNGQSSQNEYTRGPRATHPLSDCFYRHFLTFLRLIAPRSRAFIKFAYRPPESVTCAIGNKRALASLICWSPKKAFSQLIAT